MTSELLTPRTNFIFWSLLSQYDRILETKDEQTKAKFNEVLNNLKYLFLEKIKKLNSSPQPSKETK